MDWQAFSFYPTIFRIFFKGKKLSWLFFLFSQFFFVPLQKINRVVVQGRALRRLALQWSPSLSTKPLSNRTDLQQNNKTTTK